MISTREIDDIIGADAVDQDNDKIGKVGQVYVDSDSDSPTWVTVKSGLFGTSETLVPLNGADWDHSALHLAVTKDRVKDAPRVEPDAELSPEEQQRLYEYYGFGGAGDVMAGGSDQDGGLRHDDFDDAGAQRTAGYDDRPAADAGGFAATGTDLAGAGHDTSGPDTDEAMTRSEERLNVGTQQVETGRARLKKYVVTEQQTVSVPVTHEEVRVEREPITDANRGAAVDGPELSEEEHEVVLTEERPVVATETVPVERVRLATEQVTEDREVTADVRHEEIETDGGRAGLGATDRGATGRGI